MSKLKSKPLKIIEKVNNLLNLFKQGNWKIENLPKEIQLKYIFAQMEYEDLNKLAMASKEFKEVIVTEIDKNFKTLIAGQAIDNNAFGYAAFFIACELDVINVDLDKSFLSKQILHRNPNVPAEFKLCFRNLYNITDVKTLSKLGDSKYFQNFKFYRENYCGSGYKSVTGNVSFMTRLLNGSIDYMVYIHFFIVRGDNNKKEINDDFNYLINLETKLNDNESVITRIAKFVKVLEAIRTSDVELLGKVINDNLFTKEFLKVVINESGKCSEDFKILLYKNILNKFPDLLGLCAENAILSRNFNVINFLNSLDIKECKNDFYKIKCFIYKRDIDLTEAKKTLKCLLKFRALNPNSEFYFFEDDIEYETSFLNVLIEFKFFEEALMLVEHPNCDLTYTIGNGDISLQIAIKAANKIFNLLDSSDEEKNEISKLVYSMVTNENNINAKITGVNSSEERKHFYNLVDASGLHEYVKKILKERATLELYKKDLGKSSQMHL